MHPNKRPVAGHFQFRGSARRDGDLDLIPEIPFLPNLGTRAAIIPTLFHRSDRVILVIGQLKFFVRFTVGRQPVA
jgi:hypothetical protein